MTRYSSPESGGERKGRKGRRKSRSRSRERRRRSASSSRSRSKGRDRSRSRGKDRRDEMGSRLQTMAHTGVGKDDLKRWVKLPGVWSLVP